MGVVMGYHGTSFLAAKSIIEHGFRASRNEYDWLGDGVYFFQESCTRARDWAYREHGEQGVVLEAQIDLDGCMDLLDKSWFALLADTHDTVLELFRRTGLLLPKQQGGRHGMDKLIINMAAESLHAAGQPIRSVRAVFQEGRPAFPGSALFDQSHIQIAVREPSAINDVHILTADPS